MRLALVLHHTPQLFVLLAGLLAAPALVSAAPIPTRGVAWAQACAACHGPDGRSQGAIPALDTLSLEDFRTAMRAFRTEERQGTVMNQIAKGLSEADIEAVATYFAAIQSRRQQ
jgi:cytochrome c553